MPALMASIEGFIDCRARTGARAGARGIARSRGAPKLRVTRCALPFALLFAAQRPRVIPGTSAAR